MNRPGFYLAVDEKMMAVGTKDSMAVMLKVDTGKEFWGVKSQEKSFRSRF